MHTMTHSSIRGAGAMAGHGGHGAAGMDHSGDGITHTPGIIGDGDQGGIMDMAWAGIMVDIPTAVDFPIDLTVATTFGPMLYPMVA